MKTRSQELGEAVPGACPGSSGGARGLGSRVRLHCLLRPLSYREGSREGDRQGHGSLMAVQQSGWDLFVHFYELLWGKRNPED